ncbi:hypothetical protein [Methylomonas sp. AM2-LC]|uniref:hypothetical protein n=1 Tax=Methylomonas sp. AM2-LC TaxID=3153301 RepID=UPI00326316EB
MSNPVLNNYAIECKLDCKHRVMVGISAPNGGLAIELALKAFEEGTLRGNTPEMPLLFDDYEKTDKSKLRFSAHLVESFPDPEPSAIEISRRKTAFDACKALAEGELDLAVLLAGSLFPNNDSKTD